MSGLPGTLRSAAIRAINRHGGWIAGSRLKHVDFDLGRLLRESMDRTGHQDFGPSDYVQPLGLLLDTLHNEAHLTVIGRIAMRQEILHLLQTRLYIYAGRTASPNIAAAGIRQPFFITGLPRSGTTLLHNLLAQDPRFRAPAAWEVMYPAAESAAATGHADPRIARAQRRMRQLYWLAPEFRVIHPLEAALPQECIAIMSSAFVSDAFHTMCRLPSYQHWFTHKDLRAAYEYHRCFLQHLQQGEDRTQWLLKAPAHLFGLRAILDIHPDARIVFTRRDPHHALPSVANLTQVLRGAFSDHRDAVEIGREVTAYWSEGLLRAREVIRQLPDSKERCLELDYDVLVNQPLAAVERLYRHFGLTLRDVVLERMRTYLQRHPKDKFGKHRYSLARFGLDRKEIEKRFGSLQNYLSGNGNVAAERNSSADSRDSDEQFSDAP